ncbi:MAG: carbohydrate kinase family protein [Candidatus Pacebacteria bacterium]|nr:carbohydrate kinase family protein [Candidatus Paceibacterota bacterium]
MVNQYDVITFGSATWDIYLSPEKMDIISSSNFVSGKAVAFNLGSKINLKETQFNIGGGGVNSAFTFKKQGFKVAYMGSVGNDILGNEIISRLKKNKIETKLIQKTEKASTNCSIVFNHKGQDRTILNYRGASEHFTKDSFPKAKWYYLAPLSGKISKLTQKIIDYAVDEKIKIAFNPGNSQLNLPRKTLMKVIEKADVLLLNQEEAAILTKNEFKEEKKIIEDLKKINKGIVVMTKGDLGVVVIDENNKVIVKKIKPVRAVDKTGAGDAFGSAFVSGLIKYNNIDKAINLGLKNSASCVKKQGATNGLLKVK